MRRQSLCRVACLALLLLALTVPVLGPAWGQDQPPPPPPPGADATLLPPPPGPSDGAPPPPPGDSPPPPGGDATTFPPPGSSDGPPPGADSYGPPPGADDAGPPPPWSGSDGPPPDSGPPSDAPAAGGPLPLPPPPPPPGSTLATPAPLGGAAPTFGAPFSLAPLQSYKPQRGVLSSAGKDPAADQDFSVQVSVCDSLAGQQGADLTRFRKQLEDKARAEAAYQLFTRFYAGQHQSGLQAQLPVSFGQAVADRMQVQGEPRFYNGQIFGELCVALTATLPAEQVQSVTPRVVSLENFCFQQPDLSEDDLIATARQAALERIIQNLAPGAAPPKTQRDKLLQQAGVYGQLGGAGNSVYCLNMQVELSPLELGVFLPKPPPPAGEAAGQSLAKRLAATWSLDLSTFAQGEQALQFGPNMVVFRDENGKSLGPNSRDGAMAVIPLQAGADFSLRVFVRKEQGFDFLYSTPVELFRLHFANKSFEQVVYVVSLDDNKRPLAQFRSRTSKSDLFPWENATNFNDCYLIKEGAQLRFFFNGRFVMSYPTRGDTLTEVRVPLQWNERLYNVLLKPLHP